MRFTSLVLLATNFWTLSRRSERASIATLAISLRGPLLLTSLVGGHLPSLADARGSKRGRGRGHRRQGRESSNSMVTTWDIAFVLFVVIAALAFLAGWCCAVDEAVSYSTFKTLLFFIVLTIICLDFGLVGIGRLMPWAAPALLLVGFWGLLDAALRYPVAKTPCSYFGTKQVLLLIFRIVIYARAFDLSSCKIWFCTVLLVHCVVFPIAYIVALPLHESVEKQHLLAEDVVDVDILQRAALFMTKPSERRAFRLQCLRCWWGAVGVVLACAGRSPRLSRVLVRIFPALRKDARFRSRSI